MTTDDVQERGYEAGHSGASDWPPNDICELGPIAELEWLRGWDAGRECFELEQADHLRGDYLR